MRMARQYNMLKRFKRAGRGHSPGGIAGTGSGELAVKCWACPHPGINLPEGWETVAVKYAFLFMLILAMDANFRLKNRLRGNERDHTPLGLGMGYFVEPVEYKAHLKGYVNEEDVCDSCTSVHGNLPTCRFRPVLLLQLCSSAIRR